VALASDERLGVVDVVRMEVLTGAGTDEQLVTLSRLLARGVALPAVSPLDHHQAALLYRAARRSAVTVRSLIECLVAAVALRLGAPVLARDRDFEAIAQVSPLRLA
jgi:predicted nucleic acid-binding protein